MLAVDIVCDCFFFYWFDVYRTINDAIQRALWRNSIFILLHNVQCISAAQFIHTPHTHRTFRLIKPRIRTLDTTSLDWWSLATLVRCNETVYVARWMGRATKPFVMHGKSWQNYQFSISQCFDSLHFIIVCAIKISILQYIASMDGATSLRRVTLWPLANAIVEHRRFMCNASVWILRAHHDFHTNDDNRIETNISIMFKHSDALLLHCNVPCIEGKFLPTMIDYFIIILPSELRINFASQLSASI